MVLFHIFSHGCPLYCTFHSSLHTFELTSINRAIIKYHSHIASKQLLVLKTNFRSIRILFPVPQVLINNSLIVDLERKILSYHLETAAVSEYASLPVHEFMQAASSVDNLHSGSEQQVKSIADKHFCPHFVQLIGCDRLHGRFCGHRHECRSSYEAVVCGECSCSCSCSFVCVDRCVRYYLCLRLKTRIASRKREHRYEFDRASL